MGDFVKGGFIQNAVALLNGLYMSKHSHLDTMVNFINNKIGCFCSMFLAALTAIFKVLIFREKKILPVLQKRISSLTNIYQILTSINKSLVVEGPSLK